MKALVTGGTGFIGSHVVDELLENGYDVRILSKKNGYLREGVEVVIGDITSKEDMVVCLQDIDIVFHVAALSSEWDKKKNFMKINVEGTRNIAIACSRNKVKKIVYMSTAGVYGFPNVSHPIKEDDRIRLHNSYSLSKYLGEKILLGYEGIDVSIVRSPLVIGPRDRHVVPVLVERMRKGKLMYIGSKENVISISHPRDVAACLRLSGEKGMGVYNVKSFDCSIGNLFETFAEYLGFDAPCKTIPYTVAYLDAIFLEGMYRIMKKQEAPPLTRYKVHLLGTKRMISSEKAERELGFKARYNMEETVKESVEWYMDNVYKK